jgi:hypothetical protein
VLVCPPDERWGKADDEAMYTRLMRVGLQPSLGRHREFHHIWGVHRAVAVNDLLPGRTRFGKDTAGSTGKSVNLVAKHGSCKGQGDDIHIGTIACLEGMPCCTSVIRVERKVFTRNHNVIPHG